MILHHYANSPFSEKLRLIFGFKGLDWTSVTVPSVMPKPDVVALTGGYRRTPILQIGADIYCDTALAARVIDRARPVPSLYPASAPLAPILAQWADSTLFWTVIPYVMQPAGAAAIFAGVSPEGLKAFAADRAPFTAGLVRRTTADATVQLRSHLAALDAQVASGGPWLLGSEASIADFAVGHCLWFLRLAEPVAHILDPHPALSDWLDRLLAFGHGHSSRMTSADALRVAASATSHEPVSVQPGLGFEAGAPVEVAAIDYGRDPVVGELVGLSADEVVLRRRDDHAGLVHVHFPRMGFQIKQEKR